MDGFDPFVSVVESAAIREEEVPTIGAMSATAAAFDELVGGDGGGVASMLDALLFSDPFQLLTSSTTLLSTPLTQSEDVSLYSVHDQPVLSPPIEFTPKTKRRTRGIKACDFCVRRKLKCVVLPLQSVCTHCAARVQGCVFSQKQGVGGAVRRAVAVSSHANSVQRISPSSSPPMAPVPSIQRLLTPFDDLDPLPPLDTQNLLLRASFKETQAIAPILHRATFLEVRDAPYLTLSLQAVASVFSGYREDGRKIFERARRAVIPALSGEVDASQETMVQVLQAGIYLIVYCFMDGREQAKGLAVRWLALATACARHMGLNEEAVTGSDVQKESKRRLWWMLFMIDTFFSTAANTPPNILETEASRLRIIGNEASWHRNIPINDSESIQWGQVLHAIDSAKFPDLPEELRLFWSRSLGIGALLRRSNALSQSLWGRGMPSIDSPELIKLSETLETWRRCQNAFHTVGDGSASSSGHSEAGCFLIVFYHTAYLLAHSPRSEMCKLMGGAPLDPLVRAWATSPHAAICRANLEGAASFWLGMLEGDLDMVDAVGTFYDRQVSFLGLVGWDVVFAGVLQSVLDAFDTVGGGESVFPVFERTLRGMAVLWTGVGTLLPVLGGRVGVVQTRGNFKSEEDEAGGKMLLEQGSSQQWTSPASLSTSMNRIKVNRQFIAEKYFSQMVAEAAATFFEPIDVDLPLHEDDRCPLSVWGDSATTLATSPSKKLPDGSQRTGSSPKASPRRCGSSPKSSPRRSGSKMAGSSHQAQPGKPVIACPINVSDGEASVVEKNVESPDLDPARPADDSSDDCAKSVQALSREMRNLEHDLGPRFTVPTDLPRLRARRKTLNYFKWTTFEFEDHAEDVGGERDEGRAALSLGSQEKQEVEIKDGVRKRKRKRDALESKEPREKEGKDVEGPTGPKTPPSQSRKQPYPSPFVLEREETAMKSCVKKSGSGSSNRSPLLLVKRRVSFHPDNVTHVFCDAEPYSSPASPKKKKGKTREVNSSPSPRKPTATLQNLMDENGEDDDDFMPIPRSTLFKSSLKKSQGRENGLRDSDSDEHLDHGTALKRKLASHHGGAVAENAGPSFEFDQVGKVASRMRSRRPKAVPVKEYVKDEEDVAPLKRRRKEMEDEVLMEGDRRLDGRRPLRTVDKAKRGTSLNPPGHASSLVDGSDKFDTFRSDETKREDSRAAYLSTEGPTLVEEVQNLLNFPFQVRALTPLHGFKHNECKLYADALTNHLQMHMDQATTPQQGLLGNGRNSPSTKDATVIRNTISASIRSCEAFDRKERIGPKGIEIIVYTTGSSDIQTHLCKLHFLSLGLDASRPCDATAVSHHPDESELTVLPLALTNGNEVAVELVMAWFGESFGCGGERLTLGALELKRFFDNWFIVCKDKIRSEEEFWRRPLTLSLDLPRTMTGVTMIRSLMAEFQPDIVIQICDYIMEHESRTRPLASIMSRFLNFQMNGHELTKLQMNICSIDACGNFEIKGHTSLSLKYSTWPLVLLTK
ncbi:hypothetical protein HDU67_009141, partial [Dinochytrium kinnereticum]